MNISFWYRGTEVVFADLSHFPGSAIQISFTVIVYPTLLLVYSGQAAYLLENPDHVVDAFYRSIPESIYWPMFLVATGAAVVESQATISATFSLIKQALALSWLFPTGKSCPHVKGIHSNQIYISDINWILMVFCITVTAVFKNQNHIGNASVFNCTSHLLSSPPEIASAEAVTSALFHWSLSSFLTRFFSYPLVLGWNHDDS
ncbi:hypothetical protein SAY86_020879 [Trapa natans]|uniref:K+ potassium transporter integral membrane domain-containing protein n=1 Tax=Trapa natans TaxID=22666 RepID=A0AAN7MJG2_TRANT|nr:hypothetical protein SAY86_020879 [Trapa natans]